LSTANVRIGISDGMSALLVPVFASLLRSEAPRMTMIVALTQFRNVEDALLSGKIDTAVGVADEMSRSILRQPLNFGDEGPQPFKCLYDSRFGKFERRISQKEYFAREHVIVSYVGDLRGVVEDYAGRSRNVRVSVPTVGLVGGVVEGSPLLATVPGLCAPPILRAFPRLRATALPFALEPSTIELLWSRVTDEDEVARFVRGLLVRAADTIARLLAEATA
jgi:LysR family transcriptional activator of mexEF-oprN operon